MNKFTIRFHFAGRGNSWTYPHVEYDCDTAAEVARSIIGQKIWQNAGDKSADVVQMSWVNGFEVKKEETNE